MSDRKKDETDHKSKDKPKERHRDVPPKDRPIGDSKAGGETPARRFGERDFPPDYGHQGDIERPPFEGHPSPNHNKGRPQRGDRQPETEGQHGQRPAHGPGKR